MRSEKGAKTAAGGEKAALPGAVAFPFPVFASEAPDLSGASPFRFFGFYFFRGAGAACLNVPPVARIILTASSE